MNDNIKATYAFQFHKVGTLKEYYKKKGYCTQNFPEQDISLSLIVGRDCNNHIVCRIQCPINPFPIRGWWYPSAIDDVKDTLCEKGWLLCNNTPVVFPRT